jgi:hypothetical protein
MSFKGVTDVDVLLGRGSGICDKPGNKKFRSLVEQYRDEYSSSHRNEKNRIGNTVLHGVQSDGGRFLAFDEGEREWKEVPRARALEKSMQALREQSVRSSAFEKAKKDFVSPKHPNAIGKKRLSLKTPKNTGTTEPSKITPTPPAKESNNKKQSRKLKSSLNNSSKNPSVLKSFHPSVLTSPIPTSQLKFRALFPTMNRMPIISSFLPSANKRRFTAGHLPPTAAWKPCPEDTADHDMDEMRLLLQAIHSEELRREKYKYVPETPQTKKKK